MGSEPNTRDTFKVATARRLLEADEKITNGDLVAGVDLLRTVARFYKAKGYFLKAIGVLRRANKVDPSDLRIYRDLAAIYQEQGLVDEALAQLSILADYLLEHHWTREKNHDQNNGLLPLVGSHHESEIRRRLSKGEDASTEFKSTLRFNVNSKRFDDAITAGVLKSIAAFLNTRGGTLFIGVDDSGNPVGIERDGFSSSDKFLLHLHGAINTAIGQDAGTLVATEVLKIDGVEICSVECRPSKELVFLKRKGVEACFVRSGPSSVELAASRIIGYASSRALEDA